MQDLLTFEPNESIYGLTFLLAVVVRAYFFFRECHKQDLSLNNASFIMLTAFTFFLIGAKLMTFQTTDWELLLVQHQLPSAHGKTIIGGLLFGLFGFYISKALLKEWSITPDVLAIALPVAMGIQRIGCLTTGCCHGEITDGWLGVQYDSCSVAGMHQMSEGWIAPNTALTLPVFPAPLLISLGCFLIAYIIHFLRKKARLHRGYFLLMVSMYLMLTFFTDLFRSGFNNPLFGHEFAGLKLIQWVELTVAVLLFLIYRKLGKNGPAEKNRSSELNQKGRILLLILSGTPVLFFWSWFDGLEQTALIITYVPVLLFSLGHLNIPVFRFYQVSTLASTLLIVVFGRTIIAQDQRPSIINREHFPSSGEHSYTQIDVGYEMETHNHFDGAMQQSGCGGSYYTPTGSEYRHTSHSLAANYSKVKTRDRFEKHTLKSGLVATYTNETILDSTYFKNFVLGNIWGKYNFDSRWIGGGLGLSVGYNIAQDRFSGDIPVRTGGPSLKGDILWDIRVLPTRVLYLFASNGNDYFNNGLNHVIPLRPVQFGIGSGMGQLNGTRFQLGIVQYNKYRLAVMGEISYFYRNALGMSVRYMHDEEFGISFSTGISYRFDQK
ncbi:MAG: prolipoprotein diacylglyceryl transferase family protein [Bacteroidota bacterium]